MLPVIYENEEPDCLEKKRKPEPETGDWVEEQSGEGTEGQEEKRCKSLPCPSSQGQALVSPLVPLHGNAIFILSFTHTQNNFWSAMMSTP